MLHSKIAWRVVVAVAVSLTAVILLAGVVSSHIGSTSGQGVVVYADDFESGLNDWTILISPTTLSENQVVITTTPVHSGTQAAALIRPDSGYAALSRTLDITTNVRARAWVYDFGDESSGAFEAIDTITSPYYSLLAIAPNDVYSNQYALRFGLTWLTPAGTRTPGWHLFDLIVTPDGTFGRVDEKVLDRAVPTSTQAVWLNTAQTQPAGLRQLPLASQSSSLTMLRWLHHRVKTSCCYP
jgi:hypothetical protein